MALAGSNRKPALTAAAAKIGYSRATVGKLREESWQERAWGVYDKLPAVFYMTRYRSDIASKIDYFVATIDEPGLDPEVDEGAGAKVLEAEGGPELLRRIVSEFIVHWDIPGEGYLTRFDTEPFWRVLSTQELIKLGDRFMWGDDTTQMGTIEADQVYRVWDPHPRFHWLADSPVRHILEEAEELILLSRTAKVQSMSQVSAGILILPDTVDLSPFAEDEGGTEDDVARWLLEVLSRPITDPGSSASVVPAVMSMHGDDIAKVRHVTFERDWNINLDLRKELLAAVATGLDLPPEILTGMADLNHWSAWQVSESAVDQHVLPSVDAILDSLTTNWFRPLLEASGVDPEGYVLWRDPSAATVSPDQSDVAIRLYEVDAISGEAVRRVSNFDEEDAPTPEELDEKTARRSQSQQGVPTDGPPIQAALDPEFVNRVAEALWRVQEGDPPLVEAAVTAAARRRIVATELARIDTTLLAWIMERGEQEIDRLLTVALSAATDPLTEELLSDFAADLDEQIANAQQEAAAWVEQTTGQPAGFTDEEESRGQAVPLIMGAFLEAVRERLFTPSPRPDPIDLGQTPDVSLPMRQIRRGLSVAGGGAAIYEDDQAVELIGNGQRIHDELERNGFRTETYRWIYGHPKNSFEPHLRLSGVEFDSWDSPKLAVTLDGSWIGGSHFRPGDHRGCQCSFEQVLIQQLPISEAGDGVTVAAPTANIQSLADLRTWAESRGLNLSINARVTAENLPAVRQAVQAIDDMRRRFAGIWNTPRRPGLVEFDVGGPGVPGAAAFVKDRGVGQSFMSMTRFDLDSYATAGRIGRVVPQSAYEAIVHEMGHVMSNSFLPNLKPSDPLNFISMVKRNRRQVWAAGRSVDFKTLGTDLSHYAATDDVGEFWGEVFAARNASTARARLTSAALARVDEFARLVNEEARSLYGLTEDVI